MLSLCAAKDRLFTTWSEMITIINLDYYYEYWPNVLWQSLAKHYAKSFFGEITRSHSQELFLMASFWSVQKASMPIAGIILQCAEDIYAYGSIILECAEDNYACGGIGGHSWSLHDATAGDNIYRSSVFSNFEYLNRRALLSKVLRHIRAGPIQRWPTANLLHWQKARGFNSDYTFGKGIGGIRYFSYYFHIILYIFIHLFILYFCIFFIYIYFL